MLSRTQDESQGGHMALRAGDSPASWGEPVSRRPCLLVALVIRTGQKAAVCPTLALKVPMSTLDSRDGKDRDKHN